MNNVLAVVPEKIVGLSSYSISIVNDHIRINYPAWLLGRQFLPVGKFLDCLTDNYSNSLGSVCHFIPTGYNSEMFVAPKGYANYGTYRQVRNRGNH